jgi:amidophosphoribosyltransferase
VDDSIVRGTTSRKIVQLCREVGAREVHLRVSCPPTIGPCFYGIDTPRREELIASAMTVDEIRRHVGADTLGYLSLEGLLRACGTDRQSGCTACWSNEHPVTLQLGAGEQPRLFDRTRP